MAEDEGFEPIAVQYAGGILLPPVQTLVATLINRIPHPLLFGFFFCRDVGFEPIGMQHPSGVLLAASWMAATP